MRVVSCCGVAIRVARHQDIVGEPNALFGAAPLTSQCNQVQGRSGGTTALILAVHICANRGLFMVFNRQDTVADAKPL